jgi:hypothetical protein
VNLGVWAVVVNRSFRDITIDRLIRTKPFSEIESVAFAGGTIYAIPGLETRVTVDLGRAYPDGECPTHYLDEQRHLQMTPGNVVPYSVRV